LQQFGIHFVVQIVRLFVQGAVPKLIRDPAVDCVLAQKPVSGGEIDDASVT
jgi:hypothetical protein